MPRKSIPSTAVAAGKRLHRHLLETMRANRLYCDFVRQANASMMDYSTGHRHEDAASRTFTYTFSDEVEIVSGVNDRLDFKHAGGSSSLGTYAASLTPGTYSMTALASHAQAQMRSAAGSVTDISVTFQAPADSSPGHFLFQHTGSSDSPNARVFWLLCASGTNGPAGADRSAWKSFGFAHGRDRVGNFGHRGDKGFLDGQTQDQITLIDGDLVGASGLATGAVTTAKLKSGLVTTTHFDDAVIEAGNAIDGAITPAKMGAPVQCDSDIGIGAGSSSTLQFTMPNGSSSRKPMVSLQCSNTGQVDALPENIYISSGPTHISGNVWQCTVVNLSGTALTIRGYAI